MAYDFIPTRTEQITANRFAKTLKFKKTQAWRASSIDNMQDFVQNVKKLHETLLKQDKTPLSIDRDSTVIKISRQVQFKQGMNAKQFIEKLRANYGLDLTYGNGSKPTVKISAGTVFERKIADAFIQWHSGTDAFDKLKDKNLKKFVLEFVKTHNIMGIKEILVLETGKDKNLRPLTQVNDNFYVYKKGIPNIGHLIADIIIIDASEKENRVMFLSLKFGPVTSFFNLGLTKYFPSKYFNDPKGKLDEHGKALLNFFGLNEKKFKQTFTKNNQQGNTNVEPTDKTLLEKMKTFVQSGIGHGYYLVSQKTDSDQIDIISFMTRDTAKKITNFTSLKHFYGGKSMSKTGKSVVIQLANNFMTLNIEIRNTSGGRIPDKLVGYVTWKNIPIS